TATNVGSFTVNTGGTFTIDNSGTNTNNRLNAAAVLNLAGGTFTLAGNASAATNGQIGNVNVQTGFSTVNLHKRAGRNPPPTGNTLSQSGGGVVNFVPGGTGPNLGPNDNLTFTSNPPVVNGIVPFATVAGADFATLNGAAAPFTVATYTGYVASLGAATSTSN